MWSSGLRSNIDLGVHLLAYTGRVGGELRRAVSTMWMHVAFPDFPDLMAEGETFDCACASAE
jgi:hypothetical protein